MALHTLGTNTTSSLVSVTYQPTLSQADLGNWSDGIAGDHNFAALPPSTAAKGIIATGSTHSNTTLDTLVYVAGGALATIAIGDVVFGIGVPSGTFVARVISGTSVQLSNAATATAAGVYIGFVRRSPEALTGFTPSGLLLVPGRGYLYCKPGDVVARDNTGWPILISASAIAYGGSQWTYT